MFANPMLYLLQDDSIYIYVTIIIYSIPPSKCKLLDLSPTNYHQPGTQVTLLKAKLAGG